MKKRNVWLGTIVLACLVALGTASEAQIILDDLNSTVMVNDTPGSPVMNGWSVDGVSQLWNLDYYYRIGSTGPEAQLNTLAPHFATVATDTNPFTDPRDDVVSMLYTTPGFIDVELKISLMGGSEGSRWSDVAHQVRISNTGTEALDFHLFEYADFDLGGTEGGDTGTIDPLNKVMQSDGAWSMAMSEVVTPDFSHWEIANYPTLFNSLNDGATTVLNDYAGPVAGDVEYALQWDMVIQPGQTFILSKDMLIIPEPSSIAMIGLVSGFGLFIRRKFMV